MHAILVFLKAPIAGDVKTRLANSIGNAEALVAYRKLVERQLKAIPRQYRVEIHFTPSEHEDLVRDWLSDAYDYYPQCDGDLTERLTNAVSQSFQRGSEAAFCIGGDCPNLGEVQFTESAARLENSDDIVFGPTEDGGYYLVGMCAKHTEVFEGIPWSAENTLQASIQKAESLGLSVHLLNKLYDVDTIHELERARGEGLI